MRLRIYEELRRGNRYTIASGSCCPDLWTCEEFYRDPKEAARAAGALAVEGGDPYGYVGRCELPTVDFFDPRLLAEMTLERMGDTIYDLCGEAAEDWPGDDEEILDELEPIMAMFISRAITLSPEVCGVTCVETVQGACPEPKPEA